MSLRIAALVVVVACGQPTTTITTTTTTVKPAGAPPSDVVSAYVAEPAVLPPPLDVPAKKSVCSRSKASAVWPASPGAKVKFYDFTPTAIPLLYGPGDIAPAGFKRHPNAIRVAMMAHTDRLAECYEATPRKDMKKQIDFGGEHLTIEIGLSIDPFGLAHDITIDDAPKVLADCVKEALANVRVNHRTARETRANVELTYRNTSAAKVVKLSPAKPAPAERTGCMLARDPVPVDTLALEPLEIEFNPPVERFKWKRCRSNETDKADIREAIRRRLGGLRACYLDAAKRDPNLKGAVSCEFVVGRWGDLTEIKLGGAGDTALHACMKTVLSEVATTRLPEAPVKVSFPFELDPNPPSLLLDKAIEAGDFDGAAQSYAEDALEAKSADEACRARLGIVSAYARPSGGPDARTDAAVMALARFVTKDREQYASCLQDAVPVLAKIARWPVRDNWIDLMPWRGAGLEEALARTRKIVAAFPETKRTLLPFLGSGLTTMRAHDEAIEVYLQLFELGGVDKALLRLAADGYAESVRMRDEGTPWDVCEGRVAY